MNMGDNLNLGNKIRDIVQDALNNRDFKGLNKDIESVVRGALDEARDSINFNKSNYKKINNSKVFKQEDLNDKRRQNLGSNRPVRTNLRKPMPTVSIGRISGTLFTVFGSILSILFGIGIFVFTLLGFGLGMEGIFHGIALGTIPLFVLSLGLVYNGGRISKRLKRFQRYMVQLNGREYCTIKELSIGTNYSEKNTVKDLKRMIDIGMFPQGHIDSSESYFIINDKCYGEYLELQEGIRLKKLEEKEAMNKKMEMDENNKGLDPEIREAIKYGRDFISQIKDANVEIPGEEISNKLYKLEEVTGQIFDYVEHHPNKFPEIKKFTEYFLPTTLKLVDAYKKLDYQPIEGENISTAKKEIEETMDTINHAFENLLDSLFEDMAMDISTDISVLETMLIQEGLSNRDMKIKK